MAGRIWLTASPGSLKTTDHLLIHLHTGFQSTCSLLGALSQAPAACGGEGTLATLLQRPGISGG